MTDGLDPQPGLPGFWAFAAGHPDRLAAVDVNGETVTFGELLAAVNQTSRWLQSAGIGPERGFAVVTRNSVEMLTVLLAGSQIGTRVTLVNSHLTAEEVTYIVGDSDPALLITDATMAPVATAVAPHVGLDASLVFELADGVARARCGFAPSAPEARSAGSVMLYTSGTSGRPKGVRFAASPISPEEAVQSQARMLLGRFGIEPAKHVGSGTHLVTSPLYHAAPMASALLALHLGHQVVVMSRFDPIRSLSLIARHGVTWTHVVPTMMKRWLDLDNDERTAVDLSSMRWLIHAAAPCPIDVKQRILEWFGPIVFEYYSSTEVGGTAIGPTDWLAHPGSVGRPWEGADVKVLDDDGHELAAGQVGQIYMRNIRPFEYHHDPEKTSAGRRGDYVTVGDLGSCDEDGFLYIADRRTDLILSGGVNIYPAEIEAILLEHRRVADAAVIGVPDSDVGQRVHAVVVPRDSLGGDDLIAELHAFCAARLGSQKRPRSIELRLSVPRSEAGKLLRRTLRDELAPPIAEPSQQSSGALIVPAPPNR